MQTDFANLAEGAGVALANHSPVQWRAHAQLVKVADPTGEFGRALQAGADISQFKDHILETVEAPGNLLTTVGAQRLWEALIGTAITAFSNANARIGVGDSSTAATVGQTNLQASTNLLRKAMDATYPSISGATLTLRSTFATNEANFAWEEWGVFNAGSGGDMLNRRVVSLGTKTSAASWVFTVTLTLS